MQVHVHRSFVLAAKPASVLACCKVCSTVVQQNACPAGRQRSIAAFTSFCQWPHGVSYLHQPSTTGQPAATSLQCKPDMHTVTSIAVLLILYAHFLQGKATLAYSQPLEQAAQSQNRVWKIWLVCGDCVLIGTASKIAVAPVLSIMYHILFVHSL